MDSSEHDRTVDAILRAVWDGQEGNQSPAQITHRCEYCQKAFKRERTLEAHMCEKKRRWLRKDEKDVQFGFRAFQLFYRLAVNSSKEKGIKDFIHSQYYGDFVTYGTFLVANNVQPADKYTEYLIKQGTKLNQWYKDTTLEKWIKVYTKTESVERGIERSVMNLQRWADDNQCEWTDFFDRVGGGRVVHMFRTGKLSPWIVYTCDAFQRVLDRMNDEQLQLIAEYIDPAHWIDRTNKERDSVQWAEQIWRSAGV